MTNLLWPYYAAPADLATIEAIPLAERGLPATTYDVLHRAATTWPERPALSVLPDATGWQEPATRTFGQLLDDVNRVANLLHHLGVGRRDAVGLLAPNCAELITALLAAQTAGIAAPINPGLAAEQVGQLLRRSGARALVVAGPELDAASWEAGERLAREGAVDTLLVLQPTGATGPAPALPQIDGVTLGYLAELAADQPSAQLLAPAPQASDLAAIFRTGGTTGTPKLAAHTHANEVTDAWMIAAITLLDTESVIFAALPLFHVNALVVTLLAPLLRGQHVVWAGPLGYREPALHAHFWRIVAHYRVASMSAVPTVYAALAQVPVDADISSMRFAMVGASALPPAVREAFEDHTGIPLVEGYGLTEATCASARSFPDTPRPGSVGQRLPYQHAKAVRMDADGTWHDLAPDEIGVLVISGPTVFPGYVVGHDHHGPMLDGHGTLRDSWLDTGDLARVDEDGFIHLTGRAKDLIIRGGHNIDPVTIEDALLAHPAVTAAAAVGRPDHRSGEVPVAYVVLAPGTPATGDDLAQWAAGQVAERAAAPKAVHILDALPVTDVGKPYKLALRADATRRALADDLAHLPVTVEATVQNGSITVTVRTPGDIDENAVRKSLDNYSIPWRLIRNTP
ncbi:acyl-CoA synthetase [Amycolatopsis acidicola]|uniref:Acyl-CoA synthetase n=1 Tax=Amycolatopsis acidicola TaxID=2596893 RepID=A0A5N0V6E1_9PSEU|nr:acyl-CoA synthetase [Amycolatopsis acidicola]KAA9160743.1 acyl-CoA synthetase [Amycolatopsis acidicola]